MVKILVVYYSLTGNTRMIAEIIANTINSDILELKPIKELKAEGGMKYFWGGYQAIMKKKPKLNPFEINPLEYDLIFIGSPVWAWRHSSPIHSFLKKFDFSEKKVAIWMCFGGNTKKALVRFKKVLEKADILDEISFQEPLQKNPDNIKDETIKWVKNILERVQN